VNCCSFACRHTAVESESAEARRKGGRREGGREGGREGKGREGERKRKWVGNETSRVNDGTSNAQHKEVSTGDRLAEQDIKCKSEEMHRMQQSLCCQPA
jgi:hypothetical protein